MRYCVYCMVCAFYSTNDVIGVSENLVKFKKESFVQRCNGHVFEFIMIRNRWGM